mgnify:CR=1 FL=1
MLNASLIPISMRIYHGSKSRKNGDGYLFSKSVKMLPEIEETWILLNNDYEEVKGRF